MSDAPIVESSGIEHAPEITAVQQTALSQGWKPKEEFEGDAAEWVDYPEFVRRGELFGAIKESKKEVKELRKTLMELSEHHRKTLEAERKNVIEDLKKNKVEALREGEHEKVVEIDEQIAAAREVPTESVKNATPVFDKWVLDNPWYQEDKALRAFANGLVQELKEENPSIGIQEVFEKITAETKQQFPHKFQKKVSNVLSGGKGNSSLSGGTFSISDLTPVEKQLHDRFVRMGTMKSEEYIKQIKAQRQAEAR